MTSNKQPVPLWNKRNFWGHLFILFTVFVYLYSPLFDYALGHHTHSRPHSHIPVKLVQHGDHFHLIGDGSHGESGTADGHICTLDFAGLILLGLFLTFIAYTRQPIQNVFVYPLQTSWAEIILNGRPPPNPPPRFSFLSV